MDGLKISLKPHNRLLATIHLPFKKEDLRTTVGILKLWLDDEGNISAGIPYEHQDHNRFSVHQSPLHSRLFFRVSESIWQHVTLLCTPKLPCTDILTIEPYLSWVQWQNDRCRGDMAGRIKNISNSSIFFLI